jgi:protein O-mannosyl-transferase
MSNVDSDFSFSDIFLPLTSKKVIIILLVVGFIVHYHILFNGFVWDDLTYIIGNSEIKSFNLVTLIGPNMFNSSGYFRPLPAVYFSLLHQFFGSNAFFYHFLQLSLHIICSFLLYLIYRKFFSSFLSLFLTLIFLIHPINVESVAYIGSSQSQLYFLFGGLAFYFSLKDHLSTKSILSIHLLLLLALLTKEVSFLFLLTIYIYRLINQKRLTKLFIASTFLTCISYITIRLAVLGTVLQKMHLIPISEISLWQRLVHIPTILFYYLKTFFFPRILAIDQIWIITNLNWNNFYFPLIFDLLTLGGVILILLKFLKKNDPLLKPFIFFMVWFFIGISMLLQIFPLDMTVADRWFYFPFVGLLGLAGIIIDHIKLKNLLFAGLILSLLSIRTMVRNADWYNTLTLYSHDVKYYDNYDIENYLGADLVNAGKPKEALVHFIKSAQLLPHDTNIFNVGSVYELLKDYPNAQNYYQQALIVRDKYLNHTEVRQLAAEGLSRTMFRLNTPKETEIEIKKLLQEFPQNGSLWGYLAISEYMLQNKPEASAAAAAAKKYLPNQATEKLYQMIVQNQDLTPMLK